MDDRTSEDGSEDEGFGLGRPQRPSEMWEVVMEDIPEEENYGSLPGSLSSKSMLTAGPSGEFGTGGSSQCLFLSHCSSHPYMLTHFVRMLPYYSSNNWLVH